MTPQQIKNEVEKGCGKYIRGNKLLIDRDWEHDNYTCGVKRLCPSCLAKLSILTEYDKSIKEMILNLKEIYTEKGMCVLSKDIKELLSKIGDNSEVKE
jgi:hypothetical protein